MRGVRQRTAVEISLPWTPTPTDPGAAGGMRQTRVRARSAWPEDYSVTKSAMSVGHLRRQLQEKQVTAVPDDDETGVRYQPGQHVSVRPREPSGSSSPVRTRVGCSERCAATAIRPALDGPGLTGYPQDDGGSPNRAAKCSSGTRCGSRLNGGHIPMLPPTPKIRSRGDPSPMIRTSRRTPSTLTNRSKDASPGYAVTGAVDVRGLAPRATCSGHRAASACWLSRPYRRCATEP